MKLGRHPETGLFLEGHEGIGGRPPGSQNKFPTNYVRVMRELIAGRLKQLIGGEKDPIAISKIIAQLYFDGMQGKIEIRHGDKTITVSPAVFLKLFQDWAISDMDRKLKREALEAVKAKERGTGGGGIRIVLPNPIADPLLRPGQKPRPLRLLGQDPSKPLPDATGTATDAQPSRGPVPTHADGARKPADTRSTPPAITSPYQRLNQQPSPAPAPTSEDAFDPAEPIEDFEHPICQFCMGTGMVRDENGINMVTCDYCEGEGRAPALE